MRDYKTVLLIGGSKNMKWADVKHDHQYLSQPVHKAEMPPGAVTSKIQGEPRHWIEEEVYKQFGPLSCVFICEGADKEEMVSRIQDLIFRGANNDR